MVNRKEAVQINEERVEPAYKEGKSKGNMIFRARIATRRTNYKEKASKSVSTTES